MISSMSVQINGLPKLLKKLDALTREDVIKSGMYEGAQYISGWIKDNRLSGPRPQYLGVVTGRLRSSITAKPTEHSGNTYTTKIGTNVEYARVHEFGYPPRNIPARPYLVPGIQDKGNQQMVLDTIRERINQALKEAN
jgi:phage gpG-like protein